MVLTFFNWPLKTRGQKGVRAKDAEILSPGFIHLMFIELSQRAHHTFDKCTLNILLLSQWNNPKTIDKLTTTNEFLWTF